MVALINPLVDAGLVDRQVSSEDRRAFSLTLTAEGYRVHAECRRQIEEHEAALLADLTDTDKRMLLQLLSRIEARER
jgi:DNA-binding MarR family transcriptional regulator